jgi:hypothetical protein
MASSPEHDAYNAWESREKSTRGRCWWFCKPSRSYENLRKRSHDDIKRELSNDVTMATYYFSLCFLLTLPSALEKLSVITLRSSLPYVFSNDGAVDEALVQDHRRMPLEKRRVRDEA